MNTIIIWDECGQCPITFIVVEGDYSHLDRIYINACEVDSDELYTLMYDEFEDLKQTRLDTFPIEAVTKDTKIIVCGFIP